MHSRVRSSPIPAQAESREHSHAPEAVLEGAATPHPFIERRRNWPPEPLWHEALAPVQRLLTRYEKVNGELAESEEHFRGLLERVPMGVFALTGRGRVLAVNELASRIWGFGSAAEILAAGERIDDRLFADRSQWRKFVAGLRRSGQQLGFEAEIECRSGGTRWVALNVRRIAEPNSTVHYAGTVEDITDRKHTEEKVRALAYTDSVTGLPNRAYFDQFLPGALTGLRWKRGKLAILLLELDRFKMINDWLGRSFADSLLREVAIRISRVAGERGRVFRTGGAEFAIALIDIEGAEQVETVAQRVIDEVSAEFSWEDRSLAVTCNLGVSIHPQDGADGPTLIDRADAAMLAAKQPAQSAYRLFSDEMNAAIGQRLKLENDLRLALQRDELFLVYQPQVDIRTGEVCGLEALLRWRHPELGIVPPNNFIGLAESTGLIVPIGEWVLRTACREAVTWQREGHPHISVAVNVSAIQFRQKNFCEQTHQILEETGLNPACLELELTEGLLLRNEDVLMDVMSQLRELGVKLAIDDFGSGYSSLGYLRQFKVHRLKIDRSFVKDVPVSGDDAAITSAIIQMAKALNLDVLAEGVENPAQLDFLRAHDCFHIQGFYFSKPVPVDQVSAQLKRNFAREHDGE
ncbi:MAG TPA: EAL domain-containing protein [Terracidiphilus sp.]|jgi:diguanylate cyclase (GGDEF)-like protein/PAS domain S-box-containing protein